MIYVPSLFRFHLLFARWGLSLFVLLPGRSREEAFRIGREMARRVTAENPAPVELELEKVSAPVCCT